MAHYAVRESPPLRGEIPISTSKNAVLPIMCGALLTGEDVRIERVPELTDEDALRAARVLRMQREKRRRRAGSKRGRAAKSAG